MWWWVVQRPSAPCPCSAAGAVSFAALVARLETLIRALLDIASEIARA